MNKTDALRLLGEQLQLWRERSWKDLRGEVGQSLHFEVTDDSGTWYQGDVQVVWDDLPDGAIRVIASVDDGGWRAFVPLRTASYSLLTGHLLGNDVGETVRGFAR